VLVMLLTSAGALAQSGSLFAQSVKAALSKASFSATSSGVSWLALDARTGELLASRWPDQDWPIPVGSLTKPFVALAYARTHANFPRYTCAGTSTRCWLAKGHGTLNFDRALTVSCNSYFLRLAENTSPAAIREMTREFNLPAPPHGATAPELIGLDPTWRISPLVLGRAYARLATKSEAGPILAGMRHAAVSGTAGALAAEDALAKTGTAHCVEDCVASGDGFVVALTPKENPRLLLFVRQRGTTGAVTAATAARMLHRLREDHVIEP
jgi:cell division protein FtsI/penicillin-binding protein 2